jgi:hypothetical protein
VAQNEGKKHPYIIFLLSVQKETSLSGKNQKKNEKIPKTYKLQAITLTSNSH